MRISELQVEAWETAESKGWHDESRTFGDMIALAHSELSEALEDYRVEKMEIEYDETGKPTGVPIELADTVIRVAHMSEIWGIDLEAAVALKAEYNKTRPRRHGGKVL